MKLSAKHFAWANGLTYLTFVSYFLLTITECTAYWMHDASIHVTYTWLILNCSLLFLPPLLLLLLLYRFKIELFTAPFGTHFLLSLVSALFLALALHGQHQTEEGENYMFIDAPSLLLHYFLKLLSFIAAAILIYKTGRGIKQARKSAVK